MSEPNAIDDRGAVRTLTSQLCVGEVRKFTTRSRGKFVGVVLSNDPRADYINIAIDGKGWKALRSEIVAFEPAPDTADRDAVERSAGEGATMVLTDRQAADSRALRCSPPGG